MATKDDRIAWQSSLGSNGVLGIIDPVTVPRGGPGEPAENRPSDPQCIGYRTGALVAKAPEQPLKYPEPRMVKKFERATRIEAAVSAWQFHTPLRLSQLHAHTHAYACNHRPLQSHHQTLFVLD